MNFDQGYGRYQMSNPSAASPNGEGQSRHSQSAGQYQRGFIDAAASRQQTATAYEPPLHPSFAQNAYHSNIGIVPERPAAYSSHPMVVIPQRDTVGSDTYPPLISDSPSFLPNQHYYHRPAPAPLPQQPSHLPAAWQSYPRRHHQQPQIRSPNYAQHASLARPHKTLLDASQQFSSADPHVTGDKVMQPLGHSHRFPLQPQRSSNQGTVARASSLHADTTRELTKPAPPQAPPVDYQQLLLLLAEDFINAAHGMGSLVAFYRRNEDLRQYYMLTATALRCIELSLTQFRLAPQPEAQLVLQYCNLVFLETENCEEVDKWLSKTIPLCERHKLLDLKYSMQYLSARALFTTKPRVAMKSLDALILAAEAYKHVPWVYALRFLRISFSFKLGVSHQDFAAAAQNVKAVAEFASRENDAAISLLSAVYHALLHLHSMSTASIEEAQRALATAKSFQFHATSNSLRPIWILLDCIEVICYLMQGNHSMAAQKAEQLAPIMDDIQATPKPMDDGLLLVPLKGVFESLTTHSCQIFTRIDGKDHLTFQWLPLRDLWALCFLLNAIAAQTRTFADQKAEVYLKEGLKIMKENLSDLSLSRDDILLQHAPLNLTIERLDWWYNLRWFLHIYMVINATSRGMWTKAQEFLFEARGCPDVSSMNRFTSRTKWETFLQATILQGTGETTEALAMFQSPVLELSAAPAHKFHDAENDLSILSVLNSVLITLDPAHPAHRNASLLHELVSPLLTNHPNKSLRAAHDLLRSVLDPHDKIIDKKKHFANSLNAARAMNNTQLVAIALALMCTMFFKDVVGEQAQKSVKSARALADRSESPLWRCVAAGLQGQTAVRHGNEGEAEKATRSVERFVHDLPEAVRRRLGLDEH